jgi:hypothetical protein
MNSSRKPPVAPVDDSTKLEPRLSDESQAFIGLKLRELYDDVVAEPVPDRLLELLNRLGEDDKAS